MTLPLPSTAAHPVTAFYGGARAARWLARGLRAVHRLAPALGARLALGLFFTPLPTKSAARRVAVPSPWRAQRHALEGGSFVLWRRLDVDAQAPQVLLVHGWAGDAMQMRPLADALAAAGYAPLLVDLPGHGRADGWRSNLPQFVRTLFAVQARTGVLHAVVGHSLGALAAAHAVGKGLAAERLVLVAPSPPPARVIAWFAQAFGVGEVLARRMRQHIEGREGVPLAQFEPAWIGRHLARPTLIVHDRADKAAPLAAGEALARAIGGARLHVTEGLGHRRILADATVCSLIVSVL